MDDGALQALVAVLQADHALHVSRSHLLRGEAERDGPLSDLLAPLRREVSHDLPLVREREVLKTERDRRTDVRTLYWKGLSTGAASKNKR